MRRPSPDARSAGRLRRLGSRTARPSSGSVLLALGVVFAAFQLVALDLDRAPSWDEAIYLSQVEPGAVAQPLAPWRARGITFLVAPALWLGAHLTAVRAMLAVLSAFALVAAFRTWLPTVGSAAALAAALFASTWIALLYGSEVMPNLWVAFAGTGAVGLASRAGAAGRRREVALAGVLIVAAALVRPFDAALLVPIVTILFLLGGARRRAAAIPVAAWAAGTLVWLVETTVRSGGVVPALARASGADIGGKRDLPGRVVAYLGAVDGPPAPGIADPGPAWGAVVASLLVAACAVGLVRARGRPEHAPLLVTTLGGASFAGTYVAFVGTVAPRFLAPALALLSLGVAYGVRELWRGGVAGPSRRTDAGGVVVVRGAIAAAIAAWTLWQASVASSVASELSTDRETPARIGEAIAAHDRRRTPCTVIAEVWAPQIGYAAGCRGRATDGAVETVIAQERRRGAASIFVVVRRRLAATPPTLAAVPLPDGVAPPLRIYRALAGPVPR